jgi:hypothetical protein
VAPSLGIIAPLGTATSGLVIGTIQLGFEGCASLLPASDSPYRPNPAARVFVLWLPQGWRYATPDPMQQLGDPMQIIDEGGQVVADYGDLIEVVGTMAGEGGGGFCGYGQSLVADRITRVGSQASAGA